MTNEELCILIQNKSSSAFEELYQNNIKLLHSLINRFYYDKNEKDDLLSCAKIGLLNAALNFDPSYNCKFVTYCVSVILGEIKKYFRESIIHVSRGVKDLYKDIMIAQEELQIKYQREITLYDISKHLNIPIEDIIFAYESNASVVSLDASLTEDIETSLIDMISEEDELYKRELSLALDKLDKKERMIIELRYFMGYSQEEVSKRLFISQVQVSRIEKKILNKLKQLI